MDIVINVLKDTKKHVMSGISYMIPVIVLGGFATALSRMIGGVEVTGSIGYYLLQTGNASFGIMIAVLTAFIGDSIAGKPAIAPGFVAGFLSSQVKAGFLGGILSGLLIGILILLMKKYFKVGRAMKSMMPIVILPVFSGLIASLFILYVIGPPLAQLTAAVVNFFMNMNTSSKFVLGFLLGSMTGFDMGGPVNKIGFSVVSAFAAEGIWGPAAGKNAAAMAPPLGMAISALLLTPKKYTPEEREDAKVAIALSLCQVTEGALPFAFRDPVRVIAASTIGSGLAHALILVWGVEVPVLHGGVFSIPLTNKPHLWIAAYLIGALVTALICSITKPKVPIQEVTIEGEEVSDSDIEIKF